MEYIDDWYELMNSCKNLMMKQVTISISDKLIKQVTSLVTKQHYNLNVLMINAKMVSSLLKDRRSQTLYKQ